MPVEPVQLENVTLKGYLDNLKVLLLTYEGMKPLTPDVHDGLAAWVRAGGTLVVVDNDQDAFNRVREWWNEGGNRYATPREHLFERLGVAASPSEATKVGQGELVYLRRSPSEISRDPAGSDWLAERVQKHAGNFDWKEVAALVLRRGPYVVAAGLDETNAPRKVLEGDFVDLFDSALKPRTRVELGPGARHLLVDLAKAKGPVVAAGGYVHETKADGRTWEGTVEGIGGTKGVILLRAPKEPASVSIGGTPLMDRTYDAKRKLLWLRFDNKTEPQPIFVKY
jgi:hypothetical protein